MSKLEKEIKILNINIEETKSKLENIGSVYKGKKEQKIYTYDIPTIYYRYKEALELLKSENELLKNTALKKLHIVLDEFEDLVSDVELEKIYSFLQIKAFKELLNKKPEEIVCLLEKCEYLENSIKNKLINPNKWIRLRKNNDEVELTVKHIYDKNKDKIQKVKEYEVIVSELETTNEILESLGIINRNYQEKIRHSYKYKNASVELDEWPMLEPYMEIECDDEKIIEEIIEKLGFQDKEIVSLNTEQLYKRKGIDILKLSNLKF